jgi:hypothetical protein
MKKIIILLLLNLYCICITAGNKGVSVTAKFENKGLSQQVILYNNFAEGEKAEGCFYTVFPEEILEGKFERGGFNFLSPDVFHLYSPEAEAKLINRKYPLGNIDSLTYGLRIQSAISFGIKPVTAAESDSISLLFRYIVFTAQNQNNNRLTDMDYNVNAHYEHIKVKLNEPVEFNFLRRYLHGQKLEFTFSKEADENINAESFLAEEIEKECDSSKLRDVKINMSGEFVLEKADDGLFHMRIMEPPFDKRIRESELKRGNVLAVGQKGKKTRLSSDALQFSFSFPFSLYNTEKEAKYSAYKSKDKIFTSNYSVIVTPLNITADTLEASVFISVKKIAVDNLMRWTPIKMKLKFAPGVPIKLRLPKENWSANFTREGEQYDIYGYSDYEKFVEEYIILTLNSFN